MCAFLPPLQLTSHTPNMGKKDEKRNKKQVVDLTQFAAAPKVEDTLDWAQDAYNVDETQLEQEKATAGMSELAKVRIMSKNVANVENFRDKAVEYASKVVPPDMPPPFVAFVKNLLTNLPEEDVRAAFVTENLPESALKTVKIVSKEVSTFAFLEFETRENLQAAILLDGKTVRSRKMLIDIATPEQIDRMCKKGVSPTSRGSPVFGRDTMGQQRFPSSSSFNEFSRDVFGTEDSSAIRAPRSTTSSNAPRGDLSMGRDMMGSAQPSEEPRFGGGGGGRKGRSPNVSSPKTPFSSDFNFRDAPPVEVKPGSWRDQPAEQPTAVLKRNVSRDDMNKRSPNTAATKPSAGSWRDEPAEAQPGAKPTSQAAPKKAAPAAVAPPAPAVEVKKDSTVKSGLSFASLLAKK